MANWLRKMRTWRGHHPRKVDNLKLLPTAGRGVRGAEDIGGQRLSGPRVERSRQRDLGKELNAGPIGVDPNRGPQFVDHPGPPDVVGNQHACCRLGRPPGAIRSLVRRAPRRGPVGGRPASIGHRRRPRSRRSLVLRSLVAMTAALPDGPATLPCALPLSEGGRARTHRCPSRAPTDGRSVAASRLGAGGPCAAEGSAA